MRRLQDSVTRQAGSRSDAPAIVAGRERITYGELETESNRLARALGDAGCRPGDRVALLMPKSPMAIMAILGIYKANCILVPLDGTSPPLRLAKILDSCQASLVLAASALRAVLVDLSREHAIAVPPVGWLDHDVPRWRSEVSLRFTLDDVNRCPASC